MTEQTRFKLRWIYDMPFVDRKSFPPVWILDSEKEDIYSSFDELRENVPPTLTLQINKYEARNSKSFPIVSLLEAWPHEKNQIFGYVEVIQE